MTDNSGETPRPDKPFYTPEGGLTGNSLTDEQGRIQDKDIAHEFAIGDDLNRNRMAELRRQEEIGLTPDQEKNIAIMNGLQKKYHEAANLLVDSKGNEILEFRTDNPTARDRKLNIYFTSEGAMAVVVNRDENGPLVEGFKPDEIIPNIIQIRQNKEHRLPDKTVNYQSREGKTVFQAILLLVDVINNQNDRVMTKEFLSRAVEIARIRQDSVARSNAAASISSVLSDL